MDASDKSGESKPARAVLLALVIVLVFAVAFQRDERAEPAVRSARFTGREKMEPSPDSVFMEPAPERRSVYSALNRLYSTADVDPLITGHLYGYADDVRNVYSERTSHGDVHGLTEYSSAGGVGDVGVDIGPYGLDEYGGKQIGYDDGIPAPWAFPSTPVRWYAPNREDYYGLEGPTPFATALYELRVPDHDPLVN